MLLGFSISYSDGKLKPSWLSETVIARAGIPCPGLLSVVASRIGNPPTMNPAEAKRILEAALLSSPEPLTPSSLARLFDSSKADESVDEDMIRVLLDDLRRDWAGRLVELVPLATGWRFQTVPAFASRLDRLKGDRPPRYSRAVMETLAIIAYRQPVTRADIEDIRGVAVGTPVIKSLEDRGWIEVIGQREAPGRPSLLGTTKKFLDDLGLRSLEELPALEEAGTGRPLADLATPRPTTSPQH